MLLSLVLERLSRVHFSVEARETVADVVTQLVESQIALEVRLAVDVNSSPGSAGVTHSSMGAARFLLDGKRGISGTTTDK
jgi:hypothetical protein